MKEIDFRKFEKQCKYILSDIKKNQSEAYYVAKPLSVSMLSSFDNKIAEAKFNEGDMLTLDWTGRLFLPLENKDKTETDDYLRSMENLFVHVGNGTLNHITNPYALQQFVNWADTHFCFDAYSDLEEKEVIKNVLVNMFKEPEIERTFYDREPEEVER